MRSRTFLVALLAVTLLALGAHSSSLQEKKARDLSRYDDGGSYDLNWGRNGKELEEMRSKLRAFLWEHWSQHCLGHITATNYTPEGVPTTTTFYIEPDEHGAWYVATAYKAGAVAYYTVERVVGGRDTKAKEFKITWSVIPKGVRRLPSTYALRLRDARINKDDGSVESVDIAYLL